MAKIILLLQFLWWPYVQYAINMGFFKRIYECYIADMSSLVII